MATFRPSTLPRGGRTGAILLAGTLAASWCGFRDRRASERNLGCGCRSARNNRPNPVNGRSHFWCLFESSFDASSRCSMRSFRESHSGFRGASAGHAGVPLGGLCICRRVDERSGTTDSTMRTPVTHHRPPFSRTRTAPRGCASTCSGSVSEELEELELQPSESVALLLVGQSVIGGRFFRGRRLRSKLAVAQAPEHPASASQRPRAGLRAKTAFGAGRSSEPSLTSPASCLVRHAARGGRRAWLTEAAQ